MQLVSAIVIYAPHEVQQVAAPLMRQYAPDDFVRVPPHITLLFPFAPYERLPEAVPVLRDIFAQTTPFDITLDGYGQFPGVTYLKPADPAPIQALYRKVFAAFPEYPPYEGRFGTETIAPHMTVGVFADEAAQQAAVYPDYPPLTFRVTRAHLSYGISRAALPWLTYEVLPLGVG